MLLMMIMPVGSCLYYFVKNITKSVIAQSFEIVHRPKIYYEHKYTTFLYKCFDKEKYN